jgi:hypothetical protein
MFILQEDRETEIIVLDGSFGRLATKQNGTLKKILELHSKKEWTVNF